MKQRRSFISVQVRPHKKALVIALLPFAIRCSAQVPRFISARWSIETGTGKTDIGTFFSIGVSKYSGNSHLEASSVFERSDVNKIDYKSTGIMFTYNHQIAAIFPAQLYATGGTRIQYEVVRKFVPGEFRALNAAFVAGVGIDVQLSDRIQVFGDSKQYLFAQKRLGRKRYDYGFGVKMLFE